jgi:hypothetical protein
VVMVSVNVNVSTLTNVGVANVVIGLAGNFRVRLRVLEIVKGALGGVYTSEVVGKEGGGGAT